MQEHVVRQVWKRATCVNWFDSARDGTNQEGHDKYTPPSSQNAIDARDDPANLMIQAWVNVGQ